MMATNLNDALNRRLHAVIQSTDKRRCLAELCFGIRDDSRNFAQGLCNRLWVDRLSAQLSVYGRMV